VIPTKNSIKIQRGTFFPDTLYFLSQNWWKSPVLSRNKKFILLLSFQERFPAAQSMPNQETDSWYANIVLGDSAFCRVMPDMYRNIHPLRHIFVMTKQNDGWLIRKGKDYHGQIVYREQTSGILNTSLS